MSFLSISKLILEFSAQAKGVFGTIASYMLSPAESLVNSFASAISFIGSAWDTMMTTITGSKVEGTFSGLAAGAREFAGTIAKMRADLKEGSGNADKAAIAGIDAQIQTLADKVAQNEAERAAKIEDHENTMSMAASMGRTFREEDLGTPEAKKEEAKGLPAVAVMADKKEWKSEISGAADFATKLRSQQGGRQVDEKQLTELEKIREQDQKNGEYLAKLADGGMGLVLG
jgi:phage-related protein